MATRVVLTPALVAAVVASASTQPAPSECTYADACYGEPLSAPAGGLLPDSCDALWAVTPDGGLSPAGQPDVGLPAPRTPPPSAAPLVALPTVAAAPPPTLTQAPSPGVWGPALLAVGPKVRGGAAAPETPAPAPWVPAPAPPVAAAVPKAPPASLVVPPPPAGAVAPPRAPQVCTYAGACKVG